LNKSIALVHWLRGRLSAALKDVLWKSLHVPQRVLARREKKEPVHVLHIGKCGGTAIKYALRRSLATGRFSIKLHGHDFTLADVPPGEKAIFFVRDPITRFISAFYSRKRQGLPRTYVRWTDGEKRAFERFATPQELARALSSANSEERNAAIDAMRSIGHVKHGYSHWLGNEAYFLSRLADIFFIGFQETLARDFEILKAKLALPESLALPRDEIDAHRNPEHLDRKLDTASIENLAAWYAEDLKLVELLRAQAGEINRV
jgi:hypothetical protein